MSRPATTDDERPFWFPAGGEELFGILTSPTTAPIGTAAILLSGGVWTPSTGRNRVWVRLARSLAAQGFHAVRLDYHGVGESTGETLTYQLDQPFVDDVDGVIRFVRDEGVSEFFLLGACFGGRTALAAAARMEGVRGVALYGSPLRDFGMSERLESLPPSWYLKKAATRGALAGLLNAEKRAAYVRLVRKKVRRLVGRLRAASASGEADKRPQRFQWVSSLALGQLRTLVDRKVPVLLVYGEEDDFYADFCRGRSGALGELLERAGDLITVQLVEGKVHGLTTSVVQELVLRHTEAWLAGLVGAEGAAADAVRPAVPEQA